MNKLFKLSSPLPISVSVKLLGPGLSFPMVCNVPAPPAPPIPIPYPDVSMKLRIKMPTGAWSPIMTVPWKSGTIFIPKLF
jgi:hypothetical protein